MFSFKYTLNRLKLYYVPYNVMVHQLKYINNTQTIIIHVSKYFTSNETPY